MGTVLTAQGRAVEEAGRFLPYTGESRVFLVKVQKKAKPRS